jgi:putative membrane protein
MRKSNLLMLSGVILMLPACGQSTEPSRQSQAPTTMAPQAPSRQAEAPPVQQPQSPSTRAEAPSTQQPQAPSTVGVGGTPSTDEFVKTVALSDMFEIESSQLALSKMPDADTKPFAEKMVQDHQSTSQDLKSLVETGKVKATLPTTLDDKRRKMLDDLRAKNGKDFDQAYDHVQHQAHEEAVDLFQKYSENGDNPDLKAWAGRTLPKLKDHLAMSEKLK